MIVKTKTTDPQGREYDKIFSNFTQDAIVCVDGTNKVYSTKPNIAVRKGDSVFNNQVVLQMVVEGEKESYPANTSWKHIETYFKINKETLQFFREFVKVLEKELK